MVRRDTDLLLAIAGTLALVAFVGFAPGAEAPRLALGLPFVLLAPGYTLAAALFPRRHDLSIIGRGLLTVGLSLALVPLVGLGLDFTTAGVRLEPLLGVLASATIACVATAAVRRRLLPAAEAFGLPLDFSRWRWDQRRAIGLVAPALALAALGAAVYFAAASSGAKQPSSEFYILADDGQAEGYPNSLTVGQSAMLRIGVINHEREETQYRIDLTFGGRPIGYVQGLVLADGERWEEKVYLTAGGARRGQRAEFALYRAQDEEPYRNLHLTMDVQSSEPLGPPAPSPTVPGAALAAVQPPVEEAPEEPLLPAVHIVTPGEHLSLIAADYGVSLFDVIGANDLPNPNLIHPDERILVPSEGE